MAKRWAIAGAPIFSAVVGFVVGCVGAFLFLSRIWTHVFTQPDAVTAVDFYTVIGLSAAAGVVLGVASLRITARRTWMVKQQSSMKHA